MTITASPRAWSSPAVVAISLPKLRDRLTQRDVVVRLPQCVDDGERRVAAAVVDVDDLPREIQRRHHRVQPAMHFADDLCFVVHRYND